MTFSAWLRANNYTWSDMSRLQRIFAWDRWHAEQDDNMARWYERAMVLAAEYDAEARPVTVEAYEGEW